MNADPTPRRLAPLDRKMLRDLGRMKGQAGAIGAVIALGVLMLVMMDGLVNSLTETKRAYYERYRLADVFAPVKRAPKHLLVDLGKIPGVAAVEGRVNGSALINLPGIDLPVRAQAVSLPEFGSPRLDDVFLTKGRLIDTSREDEILLLDGFAQARGLAPGDEIAATMNGKRRRFHIAGLAQSPEFLYSAPPGELMPDEARFAVIWMKEKSLARAYDLDGAFNEALLALNRNAVLPAVLDSVDRLLAAEGGLGAYGLKDQFSNRVVEDEINGLRTMSGAIPPVFLAVAAFLLNMVISRLVQAEREQIGLLKAFGYTSREIGAHYFKLILIIAGGGALAGCLGGVLAGRGLAAYYVLYFKFPFLIFQVDPKTFLLGLGVSVLAASAGGVVVLRNVFSLTPAVAMRPPTPADYSRTARLGQLFKKLLDQPTRMIARRLIRQPGRFVAGVAGIAAGMAICVAMLGVMGGFDQVMDVSFSVVDRSDVTVNLVEPLSDKTVYELRQLEGVMAVEPFRSVPAVLRHGRFTYRGAISGLVANPQLNRALTTGEQPIFIRNDGVILADKLAEKLQIKPGETLTIEVNEGRRPVLEVPVVGVARTLLGSPAYMEIGALNRALKEPNRVSGAYLRIDHARSAELYRKIKAMPQVAGVNLKSAAKAAFEKMMSSSAGAMRFVMAAMAGVITFGIVYNSARIAYAERARDLASLRVIGFTKTETAYVLLGELAVITVAALPVGIGVGYFLSQAVSQGFSTDLYHIPASISAGSAAIAGLTVLTAATISGWIVKRDIDRLDMVSALKTRE